MTVKTDYAKVDQNEESYEMVPPEGGWGYIVCIGLSVIFVSILYCFIMLF